MSIKGRPDRVAWLEQIDFDVTNQSDLRKSKSWERFQVSLRKFKAREGHCRVPQRHVEDGHKLGTAVRFVRCKQQYVKGRPDRMAWLIEIGFDFSNQRDAHDTLKWERLQASLPKRLMV